jgi:hypothetical protein
MKCAGKIVFWWRWDLIETWRNLIITCQFISISNFRKNKSGIVRPEYYQMAWSFINVFGDCTLFNMASKIGLTKNVILWSYSNLSFCSGRQIVSTVYSREQGSSYQIWNYTFIHLWNLEVLFEERRKRIFLCFLKMFISHSSRKQVASSRDSRLLVVSGGEKMAVCRTLGRKLFDHILMRKLLEEGNFSVSISFFDSSVASSSHTLLLSNFAFT